MTTKNLIRSLSASLCSILSLGIAGLSATAAPASSGAARTPAGSVEVLSTTISTKQRTWSYGWPVKPFDRQHPVRAFLNDPRIGKHGGRSFHFGIDVSAPDGTAVYAVEGGKVFFDSPRAIAVVAPDLSHSFGYWHIVPVVKSHQIVRRHQLLGYIDKGWEHVHFAERRGDLYVNPLRDGGIGPYVDHTAPAVASVSLAGSDLVAVVYDTPDPRVPGDWADEPVTPARLRWRIAGGAWRTAVDFRAAILDKSEFSNVYTPATRQNHKGEPGLFSFYLRRNWTADGVTLEVEAGDIAGNRTVASVELGHGV